MTDLSQRRNRGHWSVADQQFENKIKAILWAQSHGFGPSDLQYHYNDHWWDQHDWSQEPAESLDELYRQRAQQLRDKYDTLILRFSGGADSLNILRTFADNRIHLDVVSVNLWSDGDPDRKIVPANIEKDLLAFPLLEQLKDQGAKFQVIVSDLSQLFGTIGDDPNWPLAFDAPRMTVVDVVAHQACNTDEYQPYNTHKTCVIAGVDKPQVWVTHGKIWQFKLIDCLHTMHNPCNHMVPEPFYWTADMPAIPIKQSHVVKNFFKSRQDLLNLGDDPGQRILLGKKTRLIPLIYPRYYGHLDPSADILPYYDMSEDVKAYKKQSGLGEGAPKGMGHDFTAHLSPHYNVWKQGIHRIDEMVHDRFKAGPSVWQSGLVPCWSKPRWLGK